MEGLRDYLLGATLLFGVVQSANILGLFPLPYRSHFEVFRPLLEKLAERGHQVDVLSHFPRDQHLKGYKDYSVKGSFRAVSDLKFEQLRSVSLFQVLNTVNKNCGIQACRSLINTTAAKELMTSNQKYDIIITETFFTDGLMGFANLFNAPIITMVTSVGLPWVSELIGLPDNPSYIPNYFTSFTENMDFSARFYNALSLMYAKFWYKHNILRDSNRFIKENFKSPSQDVESISKNISLVMTNSYFSLHQSRPMPPNFIEIGGIHIKPNPVLRKEEERYFETDLQGVVYVSFGTLFKSETFSDEILSSLFDALGEIPYKILWKGERSKVGQQQIVPPNINFIPWAPQIEILCHPNLTLFITHCGLGSIQEAIYCGKPVLAIPVWADQLLNANTAVSKGVGLLVPLFEVTKEKIANALKELIETSIYASNAKRASDLFRDRPMSPLDTAVYWTEYVIRHKGAAHLRSKGADLEWYKYYCIDIFLAIFVIILLLTLCLYTICRKLKCARYVYKHTKLWIYHYKAKKE